MEYFQYGVSLHTLTLLDSGSVCPEGAPTPCIVGSGGGLGLRGGYRSRGPFYLGASFQLSRLNSSNLLRLGILQRLSVEGRYYFDRGNRLTPYLLGGLGGAIYGNEWGADAGGAGLSFGVGVERTFPVHSPNIEKIEVVTRGDVRRAKLYYLRDLRGKAAKIKEKR